MTDALPNTPAPGSRASQPSSRTPGAGTVLWGSLALFAALFAFLTEQLVSGNDPAISAQTAAQQQPKPKVRRVVRTHVVTAMVPKGTSSTSSGSAASAPSPAPSVAAPAPVPAPAPAPVTTSSS